ncbi:unnamed protein product [Somion occarium]|uniref:UDP-Glycosyltransferase/glycogen phosphorylase n=1 Tax=Somion occarium TaxID=3059160 RepID=A0ABP1DKV0_9APHY
MSTPIEPTTHVVLLATEAWGHTRPLCTFAARLIQTCPVNVTFFTAPNIADRVEAEISRSFGPEDQALKDLIRVAGLHMGEPKTGEALNFTAYNEAFARAYAQLVNEETLICAHTGREIKPLAAPDAVVMDFFCVPGLEAVRKLSKKHVKVLAWMACQASFLLYPFAPVNRGGRGDYRPKVMAEVARTGRSIEEVADEVLFQSTKDIIRIPGLPPMYDYELAPQEIHLKGSAGVITMMMQTFIEACDGMILATAQPFEPEGVAEVRAWFAETSRKAYAVGPLFPLGEGAAAGERLQSDKPSEIEQFLEATLESHGPKSLLYIAFGSLYWSTEPEKIWAFLDVVMEKKIPFILSHASPFAQVPDEVAAKVKTYEQGILSKWTPQQTILAHPTIGWFVTHAGLNSTLEAISLGVPMICWPFNADQPTMAAQLCETHGIAYELFEVGTEPWGLKELHRTGKAPTGTLDAVREEARFVLDKAFGEDGASKRANMKPLQDAVSKTWEQGGPARRDLERLVASLQV